VDWNGADSQRTRFRQLLKIREHGGPGTLLDYGCGYGALLAFLRDGGDPVRYVGYDLSPEMVAAADRLHRDDPGSRFTTERDSLAPADYAVASGVFSVKQAVPEEDWWRHVVATLADLAALSRRGFAFNMLTSYSDPPRMRPDLFYADPCRVFDHCKRTYSREVALLHDYGLYEFTVLVRS